MRICPKLLFPQRFNVSRVVAAEEGGNISLVRGRICFRALIEFPHFETPLEISGSPEEMFVVSEIVSAHAEAAQPLEARLALLGFRIEVGRREVCPVARSLDPFVVAEAEDGDTQKQNREQSQKHFADALALDSLSGLLLSENPSSALSVGCLQLAFYSPSARIPFGWSTYTRVTHIAVLALIRLHLMTSFQLMFFLLIKVVCSKRSTIVRVDAPRLDHAPRVHTYHRLGVAPIFKLGCAVIGACAAPHHNGILGSSWPASPQRFDIASLF